METPPISPHPAPISEEPKKNNTVLYIVIGVVVLCCCRQPSLVQGCGIMATNSWAPACSATAWIKNYAIETAELTRRFLV
jgi:hypothetical protein